MPNKNAVKKFFIVDDDPDYRLFLGMRLKQHWPHCEIQEAVDGEEAVRVIEQWLPDVVLTDVRMPRCDGLELLSTLRAKQSIVPVIVISGMRSEEFAVAALQAGAASYMPKEQLPKLLLSTVSTVLELAMTHHNRRRVIGCLRCMDLQFELTNDHSLVAPMIKYLEDHIGSLRLCDEQELVRIGVALHESMSNAINHGNLELDSELRQEEESIYYELAEARKVMWPYCDRRVHVLASLNTDHVRFVIRDEGPGFNHRKVLDPTSAENMERIGGRGLLLIRSFMDEVSYNERGNEITLLKYTTAGRKLLATMNEKSLADTVLEFKLPPAENLVYEEPAAALKTV